MNKCIWIYAMSEYLSAVILSTDEYTSFSFILSPIVSTVPTTNHILDLMLKLLLTSLQ